MFPILLLLAVPWTIHRLPDTGQTRRYAVANGDDSTVTINPPAFTLNGNGTVTDTVTRLQWQQVDGGEMKWDAGSGYCAALGLGGVSGWRLPYAQELFTIQNHGAGNPSLDTAVFTRSTAEYWWATEPRADSATMAWAANAGGGIGAHSVSETVSAGGTKRFHVRCVRHAVAGPELPSRYTDNGDGTVTDNQTGLMWSKAETAANLTWEESFAVAGALTLAGYNDWRIPNIKELRSLHTDYAVRPSIDTKFFPNTAQAIFWSSTTQIGQNGVTAWNLDFTNGVVSYNPKTDRLRLRAVRAGAGARIAFTGVRNAASYADAPISPGEVISIFGSQVENPTVRINGATATVIAANANQINVIVPDFVSAQPTAAVTIDASPPYPMAVADAAPGIYAANATGIGPAAASLPTSRGGIVVFYATGHGLLTTMQQPTLPVEVRIDGKLCEILYAGLVPGLPAGLLQLNVRVPEAAVPGAAVPLQLKIGEAVSQPGITVTIL